MASPAAAEAERLVALWQRLAMRHVTLGVGCGCGIGGVSLRLDEFDQDIVGYLEDAGQRCGIPAVAAWVASWRPDGPDGALAPSLRDLLEQAADDRLPPEASGWLLPRVERTLRSFAEQHGPRDGA